MENIGKFEIFDIFLVKIGIALAGRIFSGGPISNDKDILQKNIFISFRYNEKEIFKKITHLDGGFGRVGLDLVVEKGDNIILLIETDNEIEILNSEKLLFPIIAEIVIK